MPGLPESYRRLASFASRVGAGTRLYDQGTVPDQFYVVLSGEVTFEVVSEEGEAEAVATAGPGALVGHIAAFTRRPTSAAARVDRESVMLLVPVARLVEALRDAPELGEQLVHALAGRDAPSAARAEQVQAGDASEPDLFARSRPAAVSAASVTPGRDATGRDDIVRLDGEHPAEQFFTDTTDCPVCRIRFEYLRVRTRAVRPTGRDSDFHVRYGDVNPTWYGVVVCPACGYAAYHDDFDALGDEATRRRLWEARDERIARVALPRHGVRTEDDAIRALELAMLCYEGRETSDSRRALLLHRRAWLARDRGEANEEIAWLRQARDAYVQAYEHDGSLSEEGAARLAYLVGDLAHRLDDLPGAARWLETAVRVAPGASSGIARTARDRLQDVRDAIKRQRLAS